MVFLASIPLFLKRGSTGIPRTNFTSKSIKLSTPQFSLEYRASKHLIMHSARYAFEAWSCQGCASWLQPIRLAIQLSCLLFYIVGIEILVFMYRFWCCFHVVLTLASSIPRKAEDVCQNLVFGCPDVSILPSEIA